MSTHAVRFAFIWTPHAHRSPCNMEHEIELVPHLPESGADALIRLAFPSGLRQPWERLAKLPNQPTKTIPAAANLAVFSASTGRLSDDRTRILFPLRSSWWLDAPAPELTEYACGWQNMTAAAAEWLGRGSFRCSSSYTPPSQIICCFWFPYHKFDSIFVENTCNIYYTLNKFNKKTRFKDLSNNTNYVP
jgi:hypothetical protein